MKVLILSCNTGEGHNTAGNAILEEFKQRGIDCQMIDALLFFGKRTSKAVSGLYKNISVRTPSLFGFIYKMSLKISTKKFKSILYYANKPSARRLYGYILENNIDTVILTHLFPAETMTSIKINRDFDFVRFYFISTDYTCYPFCEDLDPDIFFIAHDDLTDEYSSRGIKSVCGTGIPITKKFRAVYDKTQCRAELGIKSSGRVFLFMTGSMGNGNLDAIIDPLLKKINANDRIIVLGGNNHMLKITLRQRYGDAIDVINYTNKVEKYMAACDIIFTKPGGLSSTEAAVMGIPIAHTAPIPGCESNNIDFFNNRGLSIHDDNPAKLVDKALKLLDDAECLSAMKKRQELYINKNAAQDICDIIISRQNGCAT